MIFHLYLQIPYLALQTVLLITKEIIYFPFFPLSVGLKVQNIVLIKAFQYIAPNIHEAVILPFDILLQEHFADLDKNIAHCCKTKQM